MRHKYALIFAAIACLTFVEHAEQLFEKPAHFPETTYNFDLNPMSEEKVFLGRMLFYDPILSRDNSISCASCHSPYNAFAHTDHDLSHGINDQIGKRNAPALFNLAWQKQFMWDGAIVHLDMQALAPISDSTEMGESIENLTHKLQKTHNYPALFYAAFGDSNINGANLLKSLAQFQLTLVSSNSKYDKVKRNEAQFNVQEQNGYSLFQKNCNSCHTEPLFTNTGFANNGLQMDTTLNDFGRWNITKQHSDSLMFKVPSLRNLTYTYPYMHDGRFKKLSEVLNHYNSQIVPSQTTSIFLKEPMNLTSNQKVDLISFLLTLNDSSFVFNKKHQIPKEFYSTARE